MGFIYNNESHNSTLSTIKNKLILDLHVIYDTEKSEIFCRHVQLLAVVKIYLEVTLVV